MSFQVGDHVGDYEILELLGTGGMGRVFRVRHDISGRVEAMKIMLPDLQATPEMSNRFLQEIRTLAALDHANIAQLRTAFQYKNQLVMIMEFVEGERLEDRIRQGTVSLGPMPVFEAMRYIIQALSALAYAHERGVIHRDIKPSNMIVTPRRVLKLMDFGIAKSITRSGPEAVYTAPGTTLGSLYYMSPEQVRGTEIDFRSDIYSLGISLYELVTGTRPFQGKSSYEILNAQVSVQPIPPRRLNPNVPSKLNDIILTAIAKDPAHRFPSASAFAKALESVHAEPPESEIVTMPIATPVAPSPSPAIFQEPLQTRHSYTGPLVWMAIVAIMAVAIWIAWQYFRDDREVAKPAIPPMVQAKQISAAKTPEPEPVTHPEPTLHSQYPDTLSIALKQIFNAALQDGIKKTEIPENPEIAQLTAREQKLRQRSNDLAKRIEAAAPSESQSRKLAPKVASIAIGLTSAEAAIITGNAPAARKILDATEQQLKDLERKY